jgi:putative transposase
MKISIRTVNRVWGYWMKNKEPLAPKKMDKNGEFESAFGQFLAENEIKHILARVKHPQTNGKIEKWYHTYEKSRKLFDDFYKFLNWYNSVRYHESLDEKHYLQTPEDAFWSRLPDGCKLNVFLS